MRSVPDSCRQTRGPGNPYALSATGRGTTLLSSECARSEANQLRGGERQSVATLHQSARCHTEFRVGNQSKTATGVIARRTSVCLAWLPIPELSVCPIAFQTSANGDNAQSLKSASRRTRTQRLAATPTRLRRTSEHRQARKTAGAPLRPPVTRTSVARSA